MYSAGCMPPPLLLLPVDAVAGVGRTLAAAPLGPVLAPSSSLRSFSSYCDDAIARKPEVAVVGEGEGRIRVSALTDRKEGRV